MMPSHEIKLALNGFQSQRRATNLLNPIDEKYGEGLRQTFLEIERVSV